MDSIKDIIKQSKTFLGPFQDFKINDAANHPHKLFLEWYQDAIDNNVHEPHTMTLSTVDEYGYPDARVLILKDIDQHGWYFASSLNSQKGKQIELNNKVALTFYWSKIGKQIRVRGRAEKMSRRESEIDFLNRSITARALALIGKQSSLLSDQRQIEKAFQKQLSILRENPKKVSNYWTLYRVVSEEIEFWQASEERKHVRLKYKLEGDYKWVKNQLWS
jgi:pyridoxamine 5'-phosphate oxidase